MVRTSVLFSLAATDKTALVQDTDNQTVECFVFVFYRGTSLASKVLVKKENLGLIISKIIFY